MMRVTLFTDTLGDVNGVCRFIQNVAEMAERTGRDLEVITSTRLPVPTRSNIYNFAPLVAGAIPKYENLELVLPPLTKILRHLDRHQPDVIHISTPGPMGLIGYIAARMLRVPVLGVYHTDFPAYIDQLFDDHAMTWTTRQYMTWFYRPFKAVFTRSADYADRLVSLGLPRERMTALAPGVDTSVFDRRFRDPSIWSRYPATAGGDTTGNSKPGDETRGDGVVRVLYVGRVSIEKNLPLLNTVWKRAAARLRAAGARAQLVIVGDGPFRETMERELEGSGAVFLGFRHGAELSALYASSDLFVFPSVTDTLGQVVMESQASGLPVLVSDVGGPKEVVDAGRTGFVLPADRPDLWVDQIASLVTDSERRRAMGEAAFESMRAMSIERSFEHFWRVHEDAWRKHRFGGRKADVPGAPVDTGTTPAAREASPEVHADSACA
ncbi:MAG: glycosyltransferase family 1 protein [Phycisphaerales bacterium]|nr:glycosyltransferase family 1 protein [Phycisphaerales bacterium]